MPCTTSTATPTTRPFRSSGAWSPPNCWGGSRARASTTTTADLHGPLHRPLAIGGMQLRNRLYRAPVLEGAGDGPDAADAYAKQFVPNARSGVALIIQGSACVLPEGRTSPGMTLVHEPERVLAMKPMVDAVHREGAAIVLQVIRERVAERAGPDFPCLVKVPSEVSLPRFARTTAGEALRLCRLVEEWGFDAVTPVEVSVFPDTTLSRGGVPSSLWQQKAMKRRFRAAAPSRIRRGVIAAGSWVGGRRAQFRPVWNRSLFSAAKRRVAIPGLAVGGIRTAAEVDAILDQGDADLVGLGRPFYAEPDLAARILRGAGGPRLCRSSNLCVPAQMLGMRAVCYNPEVKARRR